ncbi:hypothetical protein [Umezawaea beigongshangensis]|uniref:hypothetical protein n=1 Tax=Umezawaea beigongshangensis TaxID=2780383 RepID=UPI0027DD6F9E|nr:hypothetical protein [Umezawaea beigongshangensis]
MEITRVLDAALRKAAAVWIAPRGHRGRLAQVVWRNGSLWVAVGGTEQDVPGLADGVPCTVVLRSPTTHSHLADVPVTAHLVDPDEEIAAALRAARLNADPTWREVYELAL